MDVMPSKSLVVAFVCVRFFFSFVAQIWTVWHSHKCRLSTSTRLLYIMGFVFMFIVHRIPWLSHVLCKNELLICIAIEPYNKINIMKLRFYQMDRREKSIYSFNDLLKNKNWFIRFPLPNQQNSVIFGRFCGFQLSLAKLITFAFPRIICAKRQND